MIIEPIIKKTVNQQNAEIICISDNLEIKIVKSNEDLKQARKLRLRGMSQQNNSQDKRTKQQIEKMQQNIFDGYDSYADHLIVSTLKPAKVIAYVRLIDAYTAFNLGGYFSETQFNIKNIHSNNPNLLELSRIVIAPEYQTYLTISALWQGVLKYANSKNISAIMGTFPIPLKDDFSQAEKQIKHLKAKYFSPNRLRVLPYQLIPRGFFSSSEQLIDSELLDYFFEQGPQLCGEGHWNTDLNQAELFFYYNLSANQDNILPGRTTDYELNRIVA
ncbi:MAG: GNAT family N-acetyltransferase [Pseudomonadota bacterium]